MNTVRMVAFTTTALACLQVVTASLVRVTGSAMGCGDTWPLCHGQLIPSLQDPTTLLAWTHRAVGAAVVLLTIGFLAAAWTRRRVSAPGRAGAVPTAVLALLLLAVIAATGPGLGERGPAGGLVSLGSMMAFIAAVLVAGMNAGAARTPSAATPGVRGACMVAVILCGSDMLLGGLTANAGAAGACLGFPLCDGRIWPSGGALSHIHWAHRLAGYALAVYLAGLVEAMRRRRAPPGLQLAAGFTLVITVGQVVIAGAMMVTVLQPGWRALHAVFGIAAWVSVVVLAWQVGPAVPAAGASGQAAGPAPR